MGRGEEAKTGKKKAEAGSSTSRRAVPATSSKRAEAGSKASPSKPALTAEERKQFTPNQESHGYVVARVTLRKWFWDRMDEEARSCGFNRRSEFLNAMVRRKAGTLRLDRHESLPKVTYPAPSELGEEETYGWNVPVEVKTLLDGLLEPLGDVPLKAWVIFSTLEWLGLATFPDPRQPRT